MLQYFIFLHFSSKALVLKEIFHHIKKSWHCGGLPKTCLGKGSNQRHRGLKSPSLGTNFALGTQIAKRVGFFRGRCGGNKELTPQHTESLNFMTALLMLPPDSVFLLVSQHRHRKQLRAEMTNNSSIANTIIISCATSSHRLPLVTASGLVVPGDHWARAGEAAGAAVTPQKAVLNNSCLWELPSRTCFRKTWEGCITWFDFCLSQK